MRRSSCGFVRNLGARRVVWTCEGEAWGDSRSQKKAALAFRKLVERDAHRELAAAAHLWDDSRSSKGVFVHFDSPGAAAALRAGLEREEKLSKAGRRRRAPTDRRGAFRAHRRHA